MALPYKIYSISSAETLKVLADRFKLSPSELRIFHNRYCALEDVFGGDKIPAHLREIYIPAVFDASSPSSNWNRLLENTLSRSVLKFNRTYGVVQKLFENDTQKSQLHYTIEVGNKISENLPHNCLYIKKKQSFLNEKEVDGSMDKMYEKLDRLLYPMLVNLNRDGSLQSIANKKEIAERWFKGERAEFVQYYVGDLSEKMIQKLDNFFENMEVYEDRITDSLFYTLFFMPLYVDYGANKEYHYKKEIPLFPFKKKVEYSIRQQLDTVISPSSKIFIRLKGECSDLRNPADIAVGNMGLGYKDDNKDKGKLDLTYKLNAEDKSFFSLWGEIDLDISPQKKQKVAIEIYELKNVK